ncbi:MAG: oligosaccharide flippase family protein [Cyclobacteriaceae bacterium]
MISLRSIVTGEKAKVLFDQAIYSGNGFISAIILARALHPADFGIYSGMLMLLMLWVSMGNALVIQPFQVSRHRFPGSDYTNFLLVFQVALIAILTGCVALLNELPIIDIPLWSSMVFPALVFTACFLLHDFFRKFFLAENRVTATLAIDLMATTVFLTALLVTWYRGTLNLSGAWTIAALSYFSGSLVGLVLQRPVWKNFSTWLVYFRLHVSQGKWLLMTALLQWWSANVFILTSGLLLGAEALGAFRLVQSLFGVLSMLLQTYENYVVPQVSRLFQTSAEDSRRYLRDTGLKSLIAFGSLLIVIALFPEFMIRLLGGSAYLSYGYVVQGMALLYLIIFIGYPIRVAIRIHVMNREYFLGYALTFVAGMISFRYLLENFALWGVIIGLIMNQIILLTFWQYLLTKKSYVLWR